MMSRKKVTRAAKLTESKAIRPKGKKHKGARKARDRQEIQEQKGIMVPEITRGAVV